MDSISNSGVSLILNPDIANVINDNQHQHDLSTCEEEFENQEEIQQMLVNAFDSQSLSNTNNDEHLFDDDEQDEQLPTQSLPVENIQSSQDYILLQQENVSLRHRLSEYEINEEIYRKNALEHEQQLNEFNEKYEEKMFSIRLEYETKIEELTNKMNEQQIEILTFKQIYETIVDEKIHLNEQINHIQLNEQNLQENFEKLQLEYDQLLKSNKKPLMINILTQTEPQQEIEELTKQNNQLIEQFKLLQIQYNEREQFHSSEKHPMTASVKLQTDFLDDDNKKIKQLQIELDDYKLKLNSKQIEMNSLKFDYDHLKQELNDRLSLFNSNVSIEQFNKVLSERNEYLNELNKYKNEISQLKQQMIENFQTKILTFKEQVKKSLLEKETNYQKQIQHIENEYILQYEQVLEKNKQILKTLIASKQEEFNDEKNKIILEYEEKFKILQKQQLTDDERRNYEQKIEELTRTNDKCSQYIAKREKEKTSLNIQQFDQTKRKYNDEIHRLYDQIAKQNQQQFILIDEHQKQIEQLKNTYDQRYRILLDEWKIYNNDLHKENTKLKTKSKEYEKTIVQLRYHIINLQIEYLQNSGNSNNKLNILS